MKLKFPKQITIGSYTFNVLQDKKYAGASFDFVERKIKIGTKHLENDPLSVLGLINHEIMEICFVIMACRYDDPSVTDNYKFFADHKQFETIVELFSEAISKFIA